MIRTTHISAVVIAALTLAGTASAQTAKRMSLDECRRAAVENNLAMKAGRLAVDRAKTMQGTAFDPAKTDISLSQTPVDGGGPENALSFSQSFEFPTVYAARRKQLKEETELERTRLVMTSHDVEKAVSTAYCDLLYAIEKHRILSRQGELYRQFLFLASAKMKSGETGKLEWMNARRLSKENNVALENARRDIETARINMGRLMNTDETVMPAEDSLVVLARPEADGAAFTPAATPLGAMLSQQQKLSEAGVRVARQEFMPEISVGASTQLLIKGFNPYDIDRARFADGNFMGFEVGVSVPLFFGAQRARLKAAKRDVEMAKTDAAMQLQQLETRHTEAWNAYRKAAANLDYYREQGKAEADEIVRISQVSYEKGAIGYVEYIQNLQTAVDILNGYAAAINEYNLATVNLKYIQ